MKGDGSDRVETCKKHKWQQGETHKEYRVLDFDCFVGVKGRFPLQNTIRFVFYLNYPELIEVYRREKGGDEPRESDEDKTFLLVVDWVSLQWENDAKKSLNCDYLESQNRDYN